MEIAPKTSAHSPLSLAGPTLNVPVFLGFPLVHPRPPPQAGAALGTQRPATTAAALQTPAGAAYPRAWTGAVMFFRFD